MKQYSLKIFSTHVYQNRISGSHLYLDVICFRTNQKTSARELQQEGRQIVKIQERTTMAACSSTSCQKSSKKRLPDGISDLLDVAIFSFACQTGLRSCHKVRGSPVLEGVCAFFGQLLQTANEETMQKLQEISAERFGGWQPGEEPTPQVLTFVSSRMKTFKQKQLINEDRNPVVPSLLIERKERFDEVEDRVRTRTLPRCWRCQSRCEFCLKWKRQFPTFGNFRAE